jgi:hypothetical protein
MTTTTTKKRLIDHLSLAELLGITPIRPELLRLAGLPILLGTITIGRPTPSQNVLRRRYRNKHAYARLRDELASWIMVGMANGRIPKATGKRVLIVTRYAKSKRYLLDRGNHVGGCKPLIDAAIIRGLITDDTEDALDDRYKQDIDAEAPRTEIVVADA